MIFETKEPIFHDLLMLGFYLPHPTNAKCIEFNSKNFKLNQFHALNRSIYLQLICDVQADIQSQNGMLKISRYFWS